MSRSRNGIGALLAVAGILLGAGTEAWGQCEVQRLSTDDSIPPLHLAYARSVAIDGDYAVVGARYAPVACGGLCVETGFAYVYRRNGARWVEEARLSPSDGAERDFFGESVAISGEYLVVGAWGLQAAYVFRREETGWGQAGKLVAWDDPGINFFARPVSISGDVIVLGSHTDSEAATRAGAAYVFRREGAEWLPDQKLMAGDAADYDWFGISLDVDADYIAVGSPRSDDGAGGAGSAYVFHYDGNVWVEESKLAGGGGWFGSAVRLSDRRALIGAPYHDDPATNIGAAYVFRREGTEWIEEGKLTPGGASEGDLIGFSIALTNDYILIGDGDGDGPGQVHVFRRSDTTWVEEDKLTAPRPGGFGAALAIDYGHAVVASSFEDFTEENSGATYVYALPGVCRSIRDYATFQRCFTGKSGGVLPGCESFDETQDGDVDLDDYRMLLTTFVGPRQ